MPAPASAATSVASFSVDRRRSAASIDLGPTFTISALPDVDG